MATLGGRKELNTRAEKLRQRRMETPRPIERQAGRVAPRAVWEPTVRRTAPRAYRMHSIPLSERGVEVQVPAISISFSPRGVAVAVAAAAGVGLLFLLAAGSFRAEAPVVQGANFLAADAVADASGIRGTNIFLVSESETAAQLARRMPGVKSVTVSVAWDGAVTLDIVERAPIVEWIQGGETFWVDAEGVVFPAAQSLAGMVRVDVPDRGPQIELDDRSDMDPRVVSGALELAVSLPAGSKIVFDQVHGLGMSDPGGWPVYFGNVGDISSKLVLYQRLVASLTARGIRPTLVNVEDLRQPFYRR